MNKLEDVVNYFKSEDYDCYVDEIKGLNEKSLVVRRLSYFVKINIDLVLEAPLSYLIKEVNYHMNKLKKEYEGV